MFIYEQSTGKLSHNGVVVGLPVGAGYSGHGPGRNVPAEQMVPNVGPIPVGVYSIGPVFDHPQKGPRVMRLTPVSDTVTFGRSGFMIHGDNAKGDASEGCIILPRAVREAISVVVNAGDKTLKVI